MSDTPMIKQYKAIKEKYPEEILFFRLGDFYEMFFEDAISASKILEITLTSRGKQKDKVIPMCGVPYHSAKNYIAKLVEYGKSVAICEQMEDPKLTKGIVKRDIVRIITPGTISELDINSNKTHNYLLSVYEGEYNYEIAYIDIGIGDIFYSSFAKNKIDLKNEILRVNPSEILVNDKAILENIEIDVFKTISIREIKSENLENNKIVNQYLSANNILSNAVYILLKFILTTQKSNFSFINDIVFYEIDAYMLIDHHSMRNLELFETMRNKEKRGSLFWLLDNTKTAMGRRLLKEWIKHPLLSIDKIKYRQEIVEYFINERMESDKFTSIFDKVYDLERLASKASLLQANPKDYEALKISMEHLPEIKELLNNANHFFIKNIGESFDDLEDIYLLLNRFIKENPPHILKDGGFIKADSDNELAAYYDAINNGHNWLVSFEEQEKNNTGIKNLKVKYNKVFGYHIEVSKSQLNNVPANYIRKQTIANGERYITEELKEIEKKILTAKDKSIDREVEIYEELRLKIQKLVYRIRKTAKDIANLDVYISLARVSYRNNYICPKFNTEKIFEIKEGRHPVIENLLKDEQFIPNDILLNDKEHRFLIITGPNMAGKSTYLRQTAIISLMAQIGSFVPCESANMSIVDRIFTRVGASDDLGSGQSTFMLEMTEMAYILEHYTENSLMIVDEIGRGTSTYDGLSIAWAIVEYIAHLKGVGKTLFATHYQELTELESKLDGVQNYKISVLEEDGTIKFLRKISKGSADKSYGIEVAKLAGIPDEIVNRANELLVKLEKQDSTNNYKFKEQSGQLSMIDFTNKKVELKKESKSQNFSEKLIKEIEKFDLYNTTPMDSMQFINKLKQKISNRG